jgi:dephospho-CoA kinase
MKIIAITGMPGSGKKVLRQELEKRGISVVVMRHIVENEMREKGIEVTNVNLREYATELREKFGNTVVAERTFEKVKQLDDETVIVDGIRGDMEIEFFRKQKDTELILIAVISSAETRFKRLSKRGLEWDMKTREELDYRDKKEISWGLDKAIAMADYNVDNEGTLEEFKEKINMVLNKILPKPQ